jgi:hypothetical protein
MRRIHAWGRTNAAIVEAAATAVTTAELISVLAAAMGSQVAVMALAGVELWAGQADLDTAAGTVQSQVAAVAALTRTILPMAAMVAKVSSSSITKLPA